MQKLSWTDKGLRLKIEIDLSKLFLDIVLLILPSIFNELVKSVKNYTITPGLVFGLKWQMMAGQSSVDGLGRHHQTTL